MEEKPRLWVSQSWESKYTWMLNSYWSNITFSKAEWYALLMLGLKEKNTLIRMKQAWCIDLANLFGINIYLAGSETLHWIQQWIIWTVISTFTGFVYTFIIRLLHYLIPSYSFQSCSYFNLFLHSAYLSEFVGIREFWRLYYSTWINRKWNALETRSASFNSLQKVIDTEMHLMQSDLFIQSWIYEQFTRSQMTTLF